MKKREKGREKLESYFSIFYNKNTFLFFLQIVINRNNLNLLFLMKYLWLILLLNKNFKF